jgi:hypothetical protein
VPPPEQRCHSSFLISWPSGVFAAEKIVEDSLDLAKLVEAFAKLADTWRKWGRSRCRSLPRCFSWWWRCWPLDLENNKVAVSREPFVVVPNAKILPFVNYGERSRTLHHQPEGRLTWTTAWKTAFASAAMRSGPHMATCTAKPSSTGLQPNGKCWRHRRPSSPANQIRRKSHGPPHVRRPPERSRGPVDARVFRLPVTRNAPCITRNVPHLRRARSISRKANMTRQRRPGGTKFRTACRASVPSTARSSSMGSPRDLALSTRRPFST